MGHLTSEGWWNWRMFLTVCFWERETERERARVQVGEGQRGSETEDLKRVQCWQQWAQCGAWIHKLWGHDLRWSRMLNPLSHPGGLEPKYFSIICHQSLIEGFWGWRVFHTLGLPWLLDINKKLSSNSLISLSWYGWNQDLLTSFSGTFAPHLSLLHSRCYDFHSLTHRSIHL